MPSANQTVPIVPGSIPDPTLFARETGIKSHAASGGFGVDFISAEGDASLKSDSLTLMDIPPPPVVLAGSGPFPQPFLSVSATGIASSATWSEVFPGHISVFGAASFGSLTISGSLVGYQTLTFSGNAANDTVLYDKNGVTITLDQQLVSELISCGPMGCTVTPYGITTDAIDISLLKANVGGHIVSGDIILGQSRADPPAAVPEPPGVVVILAGIVGLGYMRHRRPGVPIPLA